jgi:hypothetical protein
MNQSKTCLAGIAVLGLFSIRAIAADSPAAPYVEAIKLSKELTASPAMARMDVDAPPNGATKAALDDNARIFELVHSGAVAHSTDFGAGDATDMTLILQTLNGMRNLANLEILRARMRYSSQDYSGGQADMLDALQLSRNSAHDHPILLIRLVQTSIEESVLIHWAKFLPSEPMELVAAIPAQLSQLPASAGLAETLKAEQQFTTAQKQMTPDIANNMAPFYEAAAKLVNQNPAPTAEQLKKDLVDEAAKVQGPTARMLANIAAPSLAAVGSGLVGERTYWEMFKTGVSIVRDGPDAVKTSADPGANGPFEYLKTSNGFILRSAFLLHDKRLQMEFGS